MAGKKFVQLSAYHAVLEVPNQFLIVPLANAKEVDDFGIEVVKHFYL